MNDEGFACVLVLIFLVLPLTVVFWAVIHSAKREQQRTRETGERITMLLEKLGALSGSVRIRQELYDVLRRPVTRSSDRIPVENGWFERATPALRRLWDDPAEAALLNDYFRVFNFPPGMQSPVLQYLFAKLSDATRDSRQQELFKYVASQLLSSASPAEARWLYDRTLEQVQAQHGASAAKDLALFVGRCAYAAARHGRQPTLYDEQAIANDIAARVE